MRYTCFLLLSICLGASEGTAQRRSRAERTPQKLTGFIYQEQTYPAPSVDRSQSRYGIYLPKGYADAKNAKRRYPWAIWLHGMNSSHGKFHRNASGTLDKLRQDQRIPEMILVVPSASRRPTYINRGEGRNEEDQILVDLWKHVTTNFRVSSQRHERGILGVSMGAMAAMKMAFKYPEKFGALAVHSAPVLPADTDDLARYRRYAEQIFGKPIDKKQWQREIPLALLQQRGKPGLAGLRIYFDAGSADRYRFGPLNQGLSKTLKKLGIEHTFRYVEGGGHSWGSGAIQPAMQHSLPFVGKSFGQPLPGAPTSKPSPLKKTGKETGKDEQKKSGKKL